MRVSSRRNEDRKNEVEDCQELSLFAWRNEGAGRRNEELHLAPYFTL